MTAGFRYVKPNGATAQIDSDYVNIGFRQKFSFTLVLGQEWYTGLVSVYGSPNSIIAYSSNYPAGLLGQSYDFNTGVWTLAFASDVRNPAATVTVYVFDDVGYGVPFEASNAALLIWKPDGTLAFSSRNKYMRQIDFVSGYSDYYQAQEFVGVTKNYAFGIQTAVVQSNIYYFNDYQLTSPGPTPDFMWIQSWSAIQTSGSSLQVSLATRVTGPFNPGTGPQLADPNQWAWSYTVIDVSGL